DSAAPKAAEDGRGTLRPAVVAILKKSKNPLKTADIYDALVAQRYKFTFKEAKKVLGIRLYKMLGVQPLGGGLFEAKQGSGQGAAATRMWVPRQGPVVKEIHDPDAHWYTLPSQPDLTSAFRR